MSKFDKTLQILAQAGKTAPSAEPDAVSNYIIPLITQLGFGGVIGFCTGYMVKKVGKFAAFIVGIAFVAIQVLSYYNVINVDWGPVKDWWDRGTSPEQLTGMWTKIRHCLFATGPALGGAIPGFLLGLKAG
jgi:uncharacterized membrane protein (Fun14 family)